MRSKRTIGFGPLLCVAAVALALSLTKAGAEMRVIEAGAIPFTGFLSKADFDARYPGVSVAGPAELDTGWYVSYRHESLQYYFGPILLESTGQDYLVQLEEVVADAVALRPSIQDYEIRLSFEPSTVPPAGSSGAENPGETSPPPSGGVGTPQPQPKPSLFDLIRRIFGF